MKPPDGSSTTRDAVPIPPLNSWQTIPVPPPTPPSATGAVGRRRERLVDVVGRHVEAVDVVEQAVPGLADDRQRPDTTSRTAAAGRRCG